MKNSAIILFTLIVLFSCSQTAEKSPETRISGTIINPKGEVITFNVSDEPVMDSLDASGQFSISITLEKAKEIRFNHGGEMGTLYAHPGDQISFSLDTDEFDETLVFTGDAADINNYLASMVLFADTAISFHDLMVLDEASFLRTQDSLIGLKSSYLTNITDDVFKKSKEEEFFWNKYGQRLNYEMYHEYYLKIPLEDFKVSDDFYSFTTELDINDSTKMEIPAFKYYVSDLMNYVSKQISNKDTSLAYYDGYILAIDSMASLKPLNDRLKFDFVKGSYSYLPDDFKEGLIAEWKAGNPDSKLVEEIDQLVSSWAKLAKGQPAPDFAYESIDGDTLTMADFRGSVVYIDVWATWCGPCIGEHPFMEKLQEKFKDEKVTFLAVSIDDTKDPWIKMVNAKELGGVHVFAPGAWKASIIEDYMINGIPRFILIDQEGNIVDATAARPSGNIAEDIELLLKSV